MLYKKRVFNSLTIMVLLTALVFAGLLATENQASAGPLDPDPGTVAAIRTFTFYPETYLSGSSTAYSSSPRYYSGLNMTYIRNWHSADVFVTADVSGTASVTVTAQYSPDASNWTDAEYLSEGWVLPLNSTTTLTNASGVTNTTTSTSTTTFSGSTATRSSEWVPYRTVISTDTTEFFRLPMAGEYMRFKIEYSSVSTQGVTVTVKTTLRND